MKTTMMPTEVDRRTRWMIVDDNEATLSLMRDLSARFDEVEIECFDSPQVALDAFDAEPEAFEFVFTDLEMPGMGGFELTCRLRALSPALKILLSTWSECLSDEEAIEKGFCGWVHKPFPFAALQRATTTASLKYFEKFAGFTNGLSLVPAC